MFQGLHNSKSAGLNPPLILFYGRINHTHTMLAAKELTFRHPALNPIWKKVRSGERLSLEDGLALYASHDLIGIGRMANEVSRSKSGDSVYFVLNQKFEPTNICVLSCKF